MAQDQDLRDLRERVKPPENLEQAERNMEYIRFIVKDDVNKMMTFLSIEEFEKVRMELNLMGKTLKESTAEDIEKAYMSSYGKLVKENRFLSVLKLRELVRNENVENTDLIKKINSVVESVDRKFLLKDEVAGILYAISCNKKYDLCLKKKLLDVSKDESVEECKLPGKWRIKVEDKEIKVKEACYEVEKGRFPSIVELKETFKFFDELINKEEKKSEIEVNKVFQRNKSNVKCHHCQKLGHIMKECWIKHPELRTKNKRRVYDNKKGNYVKAKKVENNVFDEEEENDDEDCNNVMMIGLVEGDQKIMMRTVIKFGNDTIDKEMEADTGCQNTIVPDAWLNENQLRELNESQFKFIKGVGGGKKKVLGNLKCKLEVISKNGVSKEIETELMIIEDLQDALLGRRDLYRLKLLDDLQSMAVKVISVEEDKHLDKEVLDFKKKFPILTSNSPGHVKGVLLKIKKKKDRTKYFCKPREYKSDVLKDLVNKKIEYYIEQGIFEPIMYSDEAYPIVPVLKGLSKVKDQTKLTIDNVRITGDFSLYNKGLEIPSVRIKTVNGELEKINKIRGRGELIYSIFDLSDGYTALEMEPGTRTVLSTPKGLMLMKRLSQGLAPAPALYSMFMENKVVSVIESMIKKRNLENRVQILNIMDDLMVVSRSKEDNKDVVEMLGRILEDLNVRVNINKVKINKKEVEFCGVWLSQSGYTVKMGRVEKLLAMRVPQNASQLKSFLGLCNTMIRFVKDLALYKRKLEKKLNGIRTKKEAHKFEKFNEEEIKAFDELKKIISKKMIENSLIDAKEILEYRIQSDASDEAVGSLLEAKVRTDDGMKWLPIECHSRCFQGSQKKWPIQHKEAFGLYDAVKRWFGRIIGIKTTLVTDHESLSKVFSPGPNGLVNKTYSARIWRWAQFLLSVGNLEVAYRGQKAVAFADCLSRLTNADSLCDEEDEIIVANHVNLLEKRTFTNEEVKEVAECDVEYQSWVQEIEKNEIPAVFRKQDDVHVEKGLIKVGVKTVLPYDMQKEMINIAHETHMGKRGIKYRLEREFWWPTMLKDIETVCSTCEYCIRYMRSANKTEKRWEDANYFLQRIHMDQGQFYNTNSSFLVMRDAFTGYVHGKIVNSERPKEAIEFINEIERFFGTISTIVVDQQRSLVSNEMKSSFPEKQFLLVGTEVHKSNSLAETLIREIKKRARKMNFEKANGQERQTILRRILEDMNRVPCGNNELSPNEMIFNDNVNKDRLMLQFVDKGKVPKFLVGERVMFRLQRMNCYEEAIVVENSGSQICRLRKISNGREYVIHNDCIRKKITDRKKVNEQNLEILLDSETKEGGKDDGSGKDSENTVTELDKEISEVLKEMHKNEKVRNPKIPTAPFTMSLRNSKRDFSQSSRMFTKPWRS